MTTCRTGVLSMLLAAAVGASQPASAQQESPTATIAGIVSDPNGAPAEHLLLTLIGRDADLTLNVRTDSEGRYRVSQLAAGHYLLRTPVTDLLSPSMVELASGENTIDAHLDVDDTAVLIRVCRECKPAEYRLPGAITGEFTNRRDEMSAAIVTRAEPAEGWDAFNERPFPYPPAMKTSKLEGSVEIEGTITTDGSSSNLKVTSSTDSRLADAALALAQPLQWRPARVRAKPVDVTLRITVEFSIYGD